MTFVVLTALCFSSCRDMVKGDSLSADEIAYLKELALLDEGETIIAFNRRTSHKESGSFYTDKRIAGYWVGRTRQKNEIRYALYEDIKSLSFSDMSSSLSLSSFILVTKKNGRSFKVHLDGGQEEVVGFYEGVQEEWMGTLHSAD